MASVRSHLLASLAAVLLAAAPLQAAETGAHADQSEPIFMDVRLMAADLVDELVYTWLGSPPADTSALVLAEVEAPIGLDERFGVMVENRLYELLHQNPGVKIDLVHCTICTRLIAKSTPQGTIMARGIDQPEVLQSLLKEFPARRALSLSFEAEGRNLVLRAEIFDLVGVQKIIWAQSFTTSMSARRVLRDTSPLISLDAAREQQRQILEKHDPIEASTRIVVRMFNTSADAPIAAAPIPFVEQSFEAVPMPFRRLRTGVTFGFTSIKDSMSAFTVGGHLSRLVFRETPSLFNPDLYLFLGFHYIRMRGPGALPFAENQPDYDFLRGIKKEPKASLVAWRLGLETHVKHRFGALMFLENIPILKDSESIDKKAFLGVPYHDWGAGMVIRW